LRKIANKCPAARYARRPDARRPDARPDARPDVRPDARPVVPVVPAPARRPDARPVVPAPARRPDARRPEF